MTTQKFEDLSGMEGIIASLDNYAKFPLFAEDEIGRMNGKTHGMVNTTKRYVTMPVGKSYPVFDHKIAYGMIANELKSRKVACHGKFDIINDRVYADILFDEAKHIAEPGTDGMDVGISFSNPMDKKTSFKGSGYTYRLICSNGMKAKTLLPQLEISEWHTTNMLKSIAHIISDFIEASLNQTNQIEILCKKAMETKVVFANHDELTATMLTEYGTIAEKHVKGIISEIKTLEPTRWDLFNASTFYSSHTAVSRDVLDKLDLVSEKFLNVSKPITITTPLAKPAVKLHALVAR